MTKNTATVFNKFGNAIERNSVNGLSATRLNQGRKAVTAPSLPAEGFSDGQIAKKLGKTTKHSDKVSRWNSGVVANNQFIAQSTRNLYAGKQVGDIDNSLPMSFLPDTEPYERGVNPNLVGNSYNQSSGFAMKIENLTSLTAPTLDTEWKKSAGILNARKQTNPFPITINSNVRENLIHSLSRTRK